MAQNINRNKVTLTEKNKPNKWLAEELEKALHSLKMLYQQDAART